MIILLFYLAYHGFNYYVYILLAEGSYNMALNPDVVGNKDFFFKVKLFWMLRIDYLLAFHVDFFFFTKKLSLFSHVWRALLNAYKFRSKTMIWKHLNMCILGTIAKQKTWFKYIRAKNLQWKEFEDTVFDILITNFRQIWSFIIVILD